MIAALAFVLAFAMFFYAMSIKANIDAFKELKYEGNSLPVMIISSTEATNSTLVFIIRNTVQTERLKRLSDMDYKQAKAMLGLKNNFCIYFEDEKGNLVNISSILDKDTAGIGDPDAYVSGIPCG